MKNKIKCPRCGDDEVYIEYPNKWKRTWHSAKCNTCGLGEVISYDGIEEVVRKCVGKMLDWKFIHDPKEINTSIKFWHGNIT